MGVTSSITPTIVAKAWDISLSLSKNYYISYEYGIVSRLRKEVPIRLLKALTPSMSASSIADSPYPAGTLPAELQVEIAKIRVCLTAWLSATDDVRKDVSGARERMVAITEALLGLNVAEPYAFTPSPPYPFQRVLLSCIRCYWLALIASFDDFEKNEMKERLNCLPPNGDRIPRFNGEKCVEMPGELDAQEYEGLMRVIHFVVLGMVPKDVVKTWYEIGEIGVQTWEEELQE